MPLPITCPHCENSSNVPKEMLGKKIRCKACRETFVVKDESASSDEPNEDERPAQAVTDRIQNSRGLTSKSKRVRQVEEEEDEQEEEEERPRRRDKKRSAKKAASGVPVLLLAGGGAALLVVACGVGGIIWAVASKRAAPAPELIAAKPLDKPDAIKPLAPPPPNPPPPPEKLDGNTPPSTPTPPKEPLKDPGAGKPVPMDVPPVAWREYTPKNAMFTMSLPPSNKNSNRTRILTLGKHRVPVEESYSFKDGVAYSAGSIGIPALVMRDIPADRRFDVLRDMFARNIKGTVTEENDIMLDSVPGKDYLYNTPQGEVRIQIVTVAGWVVCPIVEGNLQQVRSAEADAFFATLRLSNEAKEVFRQVKR